MSKSPLVRSTTSSVAEIRTSTSKHCSWNRCSRRTSHLAAKEGDAVTVNVPVSLCARKGFRQPRQQHPGGGCELDRAVQSMKQPNPEILLQAMDLMADRGRRDME